MGGSPRAAPLSARGPAGPRAGSEAIRSAARLAERYGPWVAPGVDEILIDASGTAHLFGGERAMLEDCRRVFAWSVRAAVAGGADAARGLARFAGADLAIGTPDTVRALPVEALRLGDESTARLRRFAGLPCLSPWSIRPGASLAPPCLARRGSVHGAYRHFNAHPGHRFLPPAASRASFLGLSVRASLVPATGARTTRYGASRGIEPYQNSQYYIIGFASYLYPS